MSSELFAFRGRADIYFRFLDPALDTGYFLAGNITEMTISTESDKEDIPSFMKSRPGTFATVSGNLKNTVGFKMTGFDKRTFAMRSNGVISENQLTVETVSDEEITVKKGGMYPLDKQNIDTSQTITIKKASATLTAADAEVVDGFLHVKASGSVVDGDKLKVSYKTKAVKENRVAGGVRSNYELAIMYKGINEADGDSKFDMVVPKVDVSPDGDFSLVGESIGEGSFSGIVVTLPGKDPYQYVTYED